MAKLLILFIIVVVGGLVAFNMMNTSKVNAAIDSNHPQENAQDTETVAQNPDAKISDKPLGQQPKAIMDKAVGDFEQAQQLEQDKIDEIESLQ